MAGDLTFGWSEREGDGFELAGTAAETSPTLLPSGNVLPMARRESDEIIIMDDVRHTRRYPHVYLGEDPKVTGAREFFDNANDEVRNPENGGSTIGITLHPDGSFTISDDGRGLPVGTDPATGRNGIVRTVGTARSGGKFAKHTDAENTGAGTHGIGAAAAVFISTRCDVTVRQNGRTFVQQFSNGYPGKFSGDGFDPKAVFTRDDMMKLSGTKEPGPAHGTSIRILFDGKIAPDKPLDMDEVLLRAHAAVRMTDTVNLTVTDDGFPVPVNQDLLGSFAGPYGPEELLGFMCSAVGSPAPAAGTVAVINGRGEYNTVEGPTPFTWKMAAGPAGDGKKSVHGFCNTVRTPNGGYHVNAAVRGVSEAMAAKVTSRLKGLDLDTGESPPEAVDFAEVTAIAIDLRAPHVDWDGQSKTKVTSRSLASPIESDVRRTMTAWAANPNNTAGVLAWAKAAMAAARVRRTVDASRKRAAAANKAKEGTNLALPDKLTPCRNTGRGSDAELFLCEGDSAKATIVAARDAGFQAVYPMRGKTLNSWQKSVTDARANREFTDLEIILGCGIARSVDPDTCRYDRIIFAADADPDGKAISSQLAAVFVRFYRPLIKEKMVYVAVPPLFVVEWASRLFYCTTDTDKDTLVQEIQVLTGATDPDTGADVRFSPEAVKSAREFILDAVPESDRESMKPLLAKKTFPGKITVNRCKGLGEMDARDFRSTVLDRSTRKLIQLTIPDDDAVDKMGDMLFRQGDSFAAGRRDWMERHRTQIIEMNSEEVS